jgi:hypothetical protein
MTKITDWDAIDILYDFVKSQHRSHTAHFSASLYRWAVQHAPSHGHMEKWRRICKLWYEADILIDDPDAKDIEFQNLEKKTKGLCEIPHDLLSQHIEYIKSQRRTDGGRST